MPCIHQAVRLGLLKQRTLQASRQQSLITCSCGQPLLLACCSVLFNFLGRDFFNAISDKDAERFTQMLIKYLCAFCLGIPVFVFRDYYLSVLALEWRQWMTEQFTTEYFEDRTFYQAG